MMPARVRAALDWLAAGPGGWDGLRAEYRATFTDMRQEWQQAGEEWQETIAQIRQDKQLTRRMHQRITGKDSPTRREIRQVERAVLAELDELEAIGRRVIADHKRNQQEGKDNGSR